MIQFLVDKGATLDVVNKKGWMPVTVADGVEYTPAVLKRYPEAAALLRKMMRERGLPVPPPTHSAEAAAVTARRRQHAAAEAPARGRRRNDDLGRCLHRGAGRSRVEESTPRVRALPQEDLLGDSGTPALVGADFFSRFGGSSVDDLVKTIRRRCRRTRRIRWARRPTSTSSATC